MQGKIENSFIALGEIFVTAMRVYTTGCGLDYRRIGVRFQTEGRDFLSFTDSKTDSPIQWLPRLKLPGREAHCSHLSSAESSCISTPPYADIVPFLWEAQQSLVARVT
jgi:hypothetical protein